MAKQLDKPCGAQQAGATMLDAGPYPLQDLARLFRETPAKVLASAWAAILLDSLIEAGLRAGAIADAARAFNVVAVRLHHRPAKHIRPGKTAA